MRATFIGIFFLFLSVIPAVYYIISHAIHVQRMTPDSFGYVYRTPESRLKSVALKAPPKTGTGNWTKIDSSYSKSFDDAMHFAMSKGASGMYAKHNDPNPVTLETTPSDYYYEIVKDPSQRSINHTGAPSRNLVYYEIHKDNVTSDMTGAHYTIYKDKNLKTFEGGNWVPFEDEITAEKKYESKR